MPAYCHTTAYQNFEQAIRRIDTTAGLFHAAFAIAQHENPAADLPQAEQTLAELAAAIQRRVHTQTLDARLAHLHDVLFEVVGFVGNVDDYYNPANSYLPEVLRSRRGLPITLVLIYKCVAERIGLCVQGVNAPGHFLAAVRVDDSARHAGTSSDWMYVDPFFGGQLLKIGEVEKRIEETTGMSFPQSALLVKPATHRQWIGRMLNNLQAVFAHTGRERDLYAMQELQSLLA